MNIATQKISAAAPGAAGKTSLAMKFANRPPPQPACPEEKLLKKI
jgi:hypothetical protein